MTNVTLSIFCNGPMNVFVAFPAIPIKGVWPNVQMSPQNDCTKDWDLSKKSIEESPTVLERARFCFDLFERLRSLEGHQNCDFHLCETRTHLT